MRTDIFDNFSFFTGVPDSLLAPFSDYLIKKHGIGDGHIICANEGNCVALAAGHYIATGKPAVVYLQNSGIGNIINPVTSLISEQVYAIPIVFVIGFRGEPGLKDEPQHNYMGSITEILLKDIGIETYVVGKETKEAEIKEKLEEWQDRLNTGKSVAFLIKKGVFEKSEDVDYSNKCSMLREDAIRLIARTAENDPIICTTGKASRELFEIRRENEEENRDFLTVGSMGHCSSIALGVALGKPQKKVWCIDGDGAAIMHLGAMTTIGKSAVKNLIHIVLNNFSHESVGGIPTASDVADLCGIAKACGYKYTAKAANLKLFEEYLKDVKSAEGPSFIEVLLSAKSRKDLGRPTETPKECRDGFMKFISK